MAAQLLPGLANPAAAPPPPAATATVPTAQLDLQRSAPALVMTMTLCGACNRGSLQRAVASHDMGGCPCSTLLSCGARTSCRVSLPSVLLIGPPLSEPPLDGEELR